LLGEFLVLTQEPDDALLLGVGEVHQATDRRLHLQVAHGAADVGRETGKRNQGQRQKQRHQPPLRR
jgi:hypothetical protein